MRVLFLLLSAALLPAADLRLWTIRVEEPTGLYRRTRELVRAPLGKLGGHREGFTVVAPDNREVPWQVSGDTLLFPASLIPGELPEYRVYCCSSAGPAFVNGVTLRRIGMRRVEFGNRWFRAVIDTGIPAFVEVYNLQAGPQRMLNLVEKSPETREGLRGDIHEDTPQARRYLPPPVPGIDGDNDGWTSLGGKGGFDRVEFLEQGPLTGRIRLGRTGETWEITWTANEPWFRWKAMRGFRFASLSASPYLPFDRCVNGSEYQWPGGPGGDEPPDHQIGPRDHRKLPGGHIVYYQKTEDYGALGIAALDASLDWTGACSRRLLAAKSQGEAEIAVTFPAWKGNDTVLAAREAYRKLRQPLLAEVEGPASAPFPNVDPAPRADTPRAGNAAATAFEPQSLSLSGAWQLAWAEKGQGPPRDGWRTVQVPGSVHVQWLDPAKIYTRDAEWISTKEWWYRRTFRIPPAMQGRRLRLQFEATDYYAHAYLNGKRLGRHEGYIDPYEYEVTDRVREGDNELLVRVWTPVSYYWRHRPYTVKGAYGAVDQKPDDITALGITRAVRLTASAGAVIRDVAVDTRLLEGGAAEVEVHLERDFTAQAADWEVTLSPKTFTAPDQIQIRAPADVESRSVVLRVANPRLWWTWDHGKPDLYSLEIRLIDRESGRALDGRTLAVGIREIEKIGWDFYLNRKRMFIRGTNYYYHLFLSEMTREKYERDLKLMLGMNVNMIRLHCHFSNPEFYQLADELGVLLWQDYLEAWYPLDTDFSRKAAALYDPHIRFVRNHPSVALWATSDEEDLDNYRDLTKHLEPRPFWNDPQRRPVVRSTGRFGDSHVYYGWYGGSIWEYGQMSVPFVSELGATALPNYETLRQFMGDKWPIADHKEEWIWRRLQIDEAFRAWGDPGGMSMQAYIPRTQAYVSRLFQIALERQRRRKSEGAGGILHFHAIDIWPSVTMAAIDFNRVPTKVYDTVRRSFEPVLASLEYDRDRWAPGETVRVRVWAINDRWEPVRGAAIRWRIVGADGREQAQGQWNGLLMEADSARAVGEAAWTAAAPGSYTLRAEVVSAGGERLSENVFEFEVRAGGDQTPPAP
jgi:beta-mannosidase